MKGGSGLDLSPMGQDRVKNSEERREKRKRKMREKEMIMKIKKGIN